MNEGIFAITLGNQQEEGKAHKVYISSQVSTYAGFMC
jgi:hypothetical protein